MFEKMEILVAQPQSNKLRFQDITPFGEGGWNDGPVGDGDYNINDVTGFRISLKHHLETVFTDYNIEVGYKPIIYDTYYDLEHPSNIWVDGIWQLEYRPLQAGVPIMIGGDEVVYRLMILLSSQMSAKEGILLNKYRSMQFSTDKTDFKDSLSELQVNFKCLENLVLVNSFTEAVETFNECNDLIKQMEAV